MPERSTTDRILEILDAGLQHSREAGDHYDFGPGYCTRCYGPMATEGDICPACRAFLLEDSHHDPVTVHS